MGQRMRKSVEKNAAQMGPNCSLTWSSGPVNLSLLPSIHRKVRNNVFFCLSHLVLWISDVLEHFSSKSQILAQVSPLHISELERLNAECRQNDVSFLMAFVKGVYGAIFLDAGCGSYLFPLPPLASGSIISSISPHLEKDTYRIEIGNVADGYRHTVAQCVGLSSYACSNLPNNEQDSVPAVTTEALLHGAETYHPLTTDASRSFSSPPFEGKCFPLVPQNTYKYDSLIIRDPFGVLEGHLDEVRSWYWAPASVDIQHEPISLSHFPIDTSSAKLVSFHDFNMSTHASEYFEFMKNHCLGTSDASCTSELGQRLLSTADIYFAPTYSSIASIATNEILKLCTGTGQPISQWLIFDVPELNAHSFAPSSLDALRSAKITLAGCGPIGFELAKNITQTGIASSGSLYLVDNDTLNCRQLSDIAFADSTQLHLPLSKCLRTSLAHAGFTGKIRDYRLELEDKSSAQYSAFLWNTDLVFSATKDYSSRYFLEEQCILFETPMIDGGVSGHLGSVQACVPHLTNPYSAYKHSSEFFLETSHKDAYFPTSYRSCIKWAQTTISSHFSDPFVHGLTAYRNLDEHPLEQLTTFNLQSLHELLCKAPTRLEDCVQWALDWFHLSFDYGPRLQLLSLPLDHQSDSGEMFWKKGRIAPRSVPLNLELTHHRSAISAAALLRAVVYHILPLDSGLDRNQALLRLYETMCPMILKMAGAMRPMTFKRALDQSNEGEDDARDRLCSAIRAVLPKYKTEKLPSTPDLDLEPHVDNALLLEFQCAVANVRSSCFGLGTISQLITLQERSKFHLLTPITSTSLVASLMTIEAFKLLIARQRPLVLNSTPSGPLFHYDRFFGLSSNVFQTAPSAPLKVLINLEDRKFTSWDLLHLHVSSSITIGEFIAMVKDIYGVNVVFLAVETSLVFTTVIPHLSRRSHCNFRQATQAISSSAKSIMCQPFIELTLSAENDEGEEIEGFPKMIVHWISDSD